MRFFVIILIDKILSLLFIVMLFPAILAILLIVYFSDFNSPIYFQNRVGKNLSTFTIFKIRSMKVQKFTTSSYSTTLLHDDRITRIGSIIRKYSLDELPQLFNIFQGHMSFVGPRPVTPFEENTFSKDHWFFRHSIKPGLSGLAQISKPKTINEQEELERLTIENFSLGFYFRIIFKTFKVFNRNN